MSESLMLPVAFGEEEYEFPFSVRTQGYETRYAVRIGELEVIFERDDSGTFRALVYEQDKYKGRLPEPALLRAIGDVIEQIAG